VQPPVSIDEFHEPVTLVTAAHLSGFLSPARAKFGWCAGHTDTENSETPPTAMDTAHSIATSIDDLPPPNTKRWVIRRKAEVVAAVRSGVISLDEACRRYTLSIEEFLTWQRLIDSHGLAGLRVTRLQDYRSLERPR